MDLGSFKVFLTVLRDAEIHQMHKNKEYKTYLTITLALTCFKGPLIDIILTHKLKSFN